MRINGSPYGKFLTFMSRSMKAKSSAYNNIALKAKQKEGSTDHRKTTIQQSKKEAAR